MNKILIPTVMSPNNNLDITHYEDISNFINKKLQVINSLTKFYYYIPDLIDREVYSNCFPVNNTEKLTKQLSMLENLKENINLSKTAENLDKEKSFLYDYTLLHTAEEIKESLSNTIFKINMEQLEEVMLIQQKDILNNIAKKISSYIARLFNNELIKKNIKEYIETLSKHKKIHTICRLEDFRIVTQVFLAEKNKQKDNLDDYNEEINFIKHLFCSEYLDNNDINYNKCISDFFRTTEEIEDFYYLKTYMLSDYLEYLILKYYKEELSEEIKVFINMYSYVFFSVAHNRNPNNLSKIISYAFYMNINTINSLYGYIYIDSTFESKDISLNPDSFSASNSFRKYMYQYSDNIGNNKGKIYDNIIIPITKQGIPLNLIKRGET